MNFDVQFDMNPMTLKAELGEIYDVTGDEYENGYRDGIAAQQMVEDSIIDRSISGEYVNDRVTKVGDYAFYSCMSLEAVLLRSVVSVDPYAFHKCTAMTCADLPLVETLQVGAFNGASSLNTLVLQAGKVCKLWSINAFTGTPIASGTGNIYVPDGLAEDYKKATN